MKLLDKIKEKKATIAIIGLGYVGLPNLVQFCQKGFDAIGIDTDAKKIAQLNQMNSYVEDVSRQMLKESRTQFTVTTDIREIKKAEVVIIDVPTPLDENKEPDFSFIEVATEEVVKRAQLGQLIILESTVAPGTTEQYLVKPLEERGFIIGETIHVIYSPERVDPGNQQYKNAPIPRVIGGATQTCTNLGQHLMGDQSYPVSSLEAAELTKLYENTFRFVNIALANEMSVIAEESGLAFKEIVAAAATKPFGFMPFYPTPVIGGHCIPVAPYYLVQHAHRAELSVELIETAGKVNDSMIERLLYRVMLTLHEKNLSLSEAKISLIGATYKKSIGDTRMAGSHQIADRLIELGAEVAIYDDLVTGEFIGQSATKVKPLQAYVHKIDDIAVLLVEQAVLPTAVKKHPDLFNLTFSEMREMDDVS